jgi:hypothetical protein
VRLPWITEWDLMVGRDQHNELSIPPTPPAPPAASPMHTHLVAGTMHWATNSGDFANKNVFIQGRKPCKHFHDISMLIPHIPVPLPGWVLLPAIIPLSGSKIALGSFSVSANGDPAGAWGPTLNCWSVFPRLSGAIIPTRLPSVWVGVSFADILRSALLVGFDMLLSWALNKTFDKWLKGPLDKFLMKWLGKMVGALAEGEIVAAMSQILSKIAAEIGKKLFGKLGKAIYKFLEKKVKHWAAKTAPGMQEEHVRVLEAEAPLLFATYLHETWLPEIRSAAFESCSREYPELDASSLQDAAPEPSLDEFHQAVATTIGPMIKDAVRGLLSGDEWKKWHGSHDEDEDAEPDALPA